MKGSVIRFFILFVAMDFRIEAPLLLKRENPSKSILKISRTKKNSPLTVHSYGSSFVSPR
jgi:hypothetical protein